MTNLEHFLPRQAEKRTIKKIKHLDLAAKKKDLKKT